MSLERVLTSAEEINHEVRVAMEETTREWGIRVNRVEGKVIHAPPKRPTLQISGSWSK